MNNDKSESNSSSNSFHGEPVSRFWACLFSPSIFALIWTLKLKKTRMWLILIIGINIGVAVLSSALISDAGNLTLIEGDYNKNYMDQELIYLEEYPVLEMTSLTIISFLSIIPFIILMFRWTTAYNLATCGYKSKGEWKKSRLKDNF